MDYRAGRIISIWQPLLLSYMAWCMNLQIIGQHFQLCFISVLPNNLSFRNRIVGKKAKTY